MRGRRKKGLETALTGLEMEAALKDLGEPVELWSKEEMEAALKENDIYLEKALGELGV